MWGSKPAERIIDSIQAKGYIRTFAPLAGLVFLLAGSAIYVGQSGIEKRSRREEARILQASQVTSSMHDKVTDANSVPLAKRLRMAREAEMKASRSDISHTGSM